jgi:subtilisin family serine protease
MPKFFYYYCYLLMFSLGLLPISTTGLFAQRMDAKINVDLFQQWQEALAEGASEELVPILIKGDIAKIKNKVINQNGRFKYAVGNIAAVEIPLSQLESYLADPQILRMESQRLDGINLFEEDTAMLVNNNVTAVHQGGGILPYGFKGAGAVLGIIDDGFEWQHPDFMNPADSSSRIQYLWDQTTYNPTYFESFYAYGSSWNKTEIDAGNCTHTPGTHGSHVLGTAAGNAWAANKYMGIAPESEIVAVSLSEQGYFLHHFVDGVHYIFNKADELNLPCAINSSVGTYWGSHDGRDLFTAIIDSMIAEKAGRALIQAGGNARQSRMHWQADLEGVEDTARVWFDYTQSSLSTYTTIFADTADLSQLEFSFELVDGSTFQYKGQSRAYNLLRDVQWSALTGLGTLSDTLFYINTTPVILQWIISPYNGTYEMYLSIKTFYFSSDYWQMTVSGAGKIDLWSDNDLLGNSSMLLTSPAKHYKSPDNQQTIVSYWTCSDKVITVAAYQNRGQLINYNGDTVSLAYGGYPVRGIAEFSSLGPTRDGRQKPDLTAPGGQVMSAQPLGTLQYLINTNYTYIDVDGWHVSGKGTSMAAPMVAGAAALYFQCQPEANWEQLQLALETASRVDSFVVNEAAYIPNEHWGYGKLDVYELMKDCMVYGCMDSSAPNYNPHAHLEDGSCMLPMGLNEEGDGNFKVYPNPSNAVFYLAINEDSAQRDMLEVQVFDLLGRKMKKMEFLTTSNLIEIDLSGLASSVYVLELRVNGERKFQEKLILSKN